MNTLLKKYKLLPLKKNDIPYAAEMLACAFGENPAYSSIFPDANIRHSGLRWLFERNLRLHFSKKCTQILTAIDTDEIKEADQVIATLTLVPPSGLGINFMDYIKIGILLMPFKFGFTSLNRLFKVMNANDAAVEGVIGSSPHWYLAMVAVQDKYRRNGIATAMVNEHLSKHITGQDRSFPILLTTQTESNVILYKKIGFNIVKENNISFNDVKYYNWCMLRNVKY